MGAHALSTAQAIRTLTVVGAKGKMGRMIVARCRKEGLACHELDQPLDEAEARRVLPRSDLALLCVPAQALSEVLVRLVPMIPKGTIVADICSVKVRPLDEMLALHQGPVVGTHPLFGPVPPEGEELRVAVCPGRGDEACRQATELMARLGFAPFNADAHDHDRAMAYVQGLNFVTTVAYLASQANHEEFARYLTPSFMRRLESARKLILEDAGLFRLLFEANPYSLEAVRSYRNYLNVAAGGDLELLVERAKGWWPEGGRPGGAKGFSRGKK